LVFVDGEQLIVLSVERVQMVVDHVRFDVWEEFMMVLTCILLSCQILDEGVIDERLLLTEDRLSCREIAYFLVCLLDGSRFYLAIDSRLLGRESLPFRLPFLYFNE
jgi:hypothetical protein